MKVYPFIVINKSNMRTLEHYKDSRSVANLMYDPKTGGVKDFNNYIFIKNEAVIIDTSSMVGIGGDVFSIINRFYNLLNGN